MRQIHDQLRGLVPLILRPVLSPLLRWHVHPNVVTTLGFFITISSGIAFFLLHVRIGGFLMLLGGVFDIIDGQLAREGGTTSRFGSFYDATLDRISEIVVFLGIFSLYGGGHPDLHYPWMVYTVALAMAGSLMVSYTRARAEVMGLDCKVGFMQRLERVILLGGAAMLFGTDLDGLVMTGVLLAMATLTNLTAFQRIVWVYRHTREPEVAEPAPAAIPLKRSSQSQING